MDEVKNTEGASASDAGTQPVEKTQEVDNSMAEVLETIPKILDENEKLKKDNENYKTGMLTYKKQLKDLKEQGYDVQIEEDKPVINTDDIVARVVEQLKPIISKPIEDESSILKNKVSELALAIKNRSQINSTGAGSNVESAKEPVSKFFSTEQEANLKSRGLDIEKVKANMLRYKQNQVI
jgi:dsDNA-specific endonuclease/ATPase MutS2